MEQTFIMIKPDGVQRGLVSLLSLWDVPSWWEISNFLKIKWNKFDRPDGVFDVFQVGEIIGRFEKKGFTLKGNSGEGGYFAVLVF